MKKFFKDAWGIIKRVPPQFQKGDPVVYSAAIAFFTIFSMPSILMIITYLASLIRQEGAVKSELLTQIESLVGQNTAEIVDTVIENASLSESGIPATLLSLVILLISATAIFNFIQKAMNSIWEVKPKPEKGLLKFLKDRVLSFSMIIALGFLMLVSLVIDTLFNVLRSFINEHFAAFASYLMSALNLIINFSIVIFVFLLVFKVLPDAKIRWKDSFGGALVTGILFTLGKYIIGIILSQSNITNTYAAAGSLAGILVWVFYSSIILMIGAVFTKVYADQVGREIEPSPTSVRVVTKEIEKE